MPAKSPRRLTALAYFMLLGIGVVFSLAGVATKEIANFFQVDTYLVGYLFTLFSAGYSLAILGNGFLLSRIDVRLETAAAAALSIASVIGATTWPSLGLFAVFVFFYGAGLGVLCSVGYYIIVNLYDETARAGRLNILNFFFSVGAIVAPVLAGLALAAGVKWQWLYLATAPLLGLVIISALPLSFEIRPQQAVPEAAEDSPTDWPSTVYIIGLALLCYVLSEMIFCYWVVAYMMDKLAVDVALASLSLSIFWSLMAVGRLAAGTVIEKTGIIPYILTNAAVAFVAFGTLLTVETPYLALALVALMGLSYSGLYSTTLAYGTQQIAGPSPRLTTFYLTIGAGGGILSFLLSSWLKQCFDIKATLIVAALLIGLVGLLAFSARSRNAVQA